METILWSGQGQNSKDEPGRQVQGTPEGLILIAADNRLEVKWREDE